jgi:hypothetical protein
LKGLTWKLGLITSLAALPVLAPYCAKDDCYDRGGALDSTGTNCAFPGLALGAVVSRIRQNRSARRAA